MLPEAGNFSADKEPADISEWWSDVSLLSKIIVIVSKSPFRHTPEKLITKQFHLYTILTQKFKLIKLQDNSSDIFRRLKTHSLNDISAIISIKREYGDRLMANDSDETKWPTLKS